MREREVKSCRSEANHYAKPSQHEERRQRKLGRESDASTLVAPLIILTSERRLHTQHQTDRQTADCEGASHTSRCEMRWRAKRHQHSHQHASPILAVSVPGERSERARMHARIPCVDPHETLIPRTKGQQRAFARDSCTASPAAHVGSRCTLMTDDRLACPLLVPSSQTQK